MLKDDIRANLTSPPHFPAPAWSCYPATFLFFSRDHFLAGIISETVSRHAAVFLKYFALANRQRPPFLQPGNYFAPQFLVIPVNTIKRIAGMNIPGKDGLIQLFRRFIDHGIHLSLLFKTSSSYPKAYFA
jgi:hypothetical protein